MPVVLRRIFIPVTLMALSLPGLAGKAVAAQGDLDASFDGDGIVTTTFGAAVSNVGSAVALQADGKIVAAGYSFNGSNADFALARYTASGALDPTFGTGGKVTTPIGSGNAVANAVAVQADGKIVAAGVAHNGSNNDFALARYTSTGALDTTFSSDGKLTTFIFGFDDVAEDVAVQDDGKIVAVGHAFNGSNDDIALVRYNTNGGQDSTFNGTGKVTTAIGSTNDTANAVAIQDDGRIVVAGSSSVGFDGEFALVRYSNVGALDTSFDGDGKVTTPIGSSPSFDNVEDLAIQDDGRIVAVGQASNGLNDDFALARYTTSGATDSSFDGDGKVITPIGSSQDQATAVAMQADGKIVAAGSTQGTSVAFALARYSTSGALDSTFGSGGKVTSPAGSAEDVAIQDDGRIVTAGHDSGATTFVLARYIGSPAISVADVSVTEGDSASEVVTFVISLSQKATAPISVDFYTKDGTATAGTDYDARQGTRVFFTGQKTKQVTVQVSPDTLQEGNETFSLRLADSQSGYILDGEAVATITDNDLPKASVNDVTQLEVNSGSNKTYAFKITLDKAGTNSIIISYGTADGTAVAPGDYTAKSGSVTFSPGTVTKTVNVTVKGDNAVEATETFFLNISTTSPFVVLADPQGVGTITNND